MERKDYFENLLKEDNEFADDVVFARFINYMKKALLHKRIDYIRHQEYLTRKEKFITHEEWSVLSGDDTFCSFFAFNPNNKHKLSGAIKQLTERQQIIITSFYYEKKTLKSIANELKSTVDSIAHSKQKAIAKLKKYLEDSSNEKSN